MICCCGSEVNGAFHRIGCSHCLASSCASSFHAHAAERQHLDNHPQLRQPHAVPAAKANHVCSSSAAITQAHSRALVIMKQMNTGHAACWRFLCIMECTWHCFTCATTVRLCKARDTPLADLWSSPPHPLPPSPVPPVGTPTEISTAFDVTTFQEPPPHP